MSDYPKTPLMEKGKKYDVVQSCYGQEHTQYGLMCCSVTRHGDYRISYLLTHHEDGIDYGHYYWERPEWECTQQRIVRVTLSEEK